MAKAGPFLTLPSFKQGFLLHVFRLPAATARSRWGCPAPHAPSVHQAALGRRPNGLATIGEVHKKGFGRVAGVGGRRPERETIIYIPDHKRVPRRQDITPVRVIDQACELLYLWEAPSHEIPRSRHQG